MTKKDDHIDPEDIIHALNNPVQSLHEGEAATTPPKIDPSKLKLDQFHPLDHHPWERRCREFYGGWRHHIALDWAYRKGPKVRSWTLCRIGRHSVWRAHRGNETALVCNDCGQVLEGWCEFHE